APQTDDFAAICSELDIPFTDRPARDIDHAGRDAKSRDGFHWTEKGHAIIAKRLAPWIRKQWLAAVPPDK
ncbi:MAG: hypothetical protein AAFV07_14120, partial [Bacteroidota bacterium]